MAVKFWSWLGHPLVHKYHIMLLTLLSWRWRHQVPVKCQCLSIKLLGITSQKMVIGMVTAMTTHISVTLFSCYVLGLKKMLVDGPWRNWRICWTIYELKMILVSILYSVLYMYMYSAIGIVTGYGLDGWGFGVWVPVGAELFSFLRCPNPILGSSQPPIQWVPESVSPGVKRPGHEADHSPEVKKTWIYTSTSPYAFMAWCLIS
jgi:hypothetical protein